MSSGYQLDANAMAVRIAGCIPEGGAHAVTSEANRMAATAVTAIRVRFMAFRAGEWGWWSNAVSGEARQRPVRGLHAGVGGLVRIVPWWVGGVGDFPHGCPPAGPARR